MKSMPIEIHANNVMLWTIQLGVASKLDRRVNKQTYLNGEGEQGHEQIPEYQSTLQTQIN